MRRIRELLRLKFEFNLGNRKIANSCSMAHSTVGHDCECGGTPHNTRIEEGPYSVSCPLCRSSTPDYREVIYAQRMWNNWCWKLKYCVPDDAIAYNNDQKCYSLYFSISGGGSQKQQRQFVSSALRHWAWPWHFGQLSGSFASSISIDF